MISRKCWIVLRRSHLNTSLRTQILFLGNYQESLNDAKAAVELQPNYIKAIARGKVLLPIGCLLWHRALQIIVSVPASRVDISNLDRQMPGYGPPRCGSILFIVYRNVFSKLSPPSWNFQVVHPPSEHSRALVLVRSSWKVKNQNIETLDTWLTFIRSKCLWGAWSVRRSRYLVWQGIGSILWQHSLNLLPAKCNISFG